jgi:outer membrane lipoprotein SlyB
MKIFLARSIIAVTALTLGACASSGPRQVVPTYYVNAVVVDYERAPKVCYVRNSKNSTKGSALGGGLLGGVIGGVIGNQFGGGDGKVVATILGTGLGAVAGSAIAVSSDYKPREGEKLDCKRNGYMAELVYRHPESGLATTEHRNFEDRPSRNGKVNIPVHGQPVWVQ